MGRRDDYGAANADGKPARARGLGRQARAAVLAFGASFGRVAGSVGRILEGPPSAVLSLLLALGLGLFVLRQMQTPVPSVVRGAEGAQPSLLVPEPSPVQRAPVAPRPAVAQVDPGPGPLSVYLVVSQELAADFARRIAEMNEIRYQELLPPVEAVFLVAGTPEDEAVALNRIYELSAVNDQTRRLPFVLYDTRKR